MLKKIITIFILVLLIGILIFYLEKIETSKEIMPLNYSFDPILILKEKVILSDEFEFRWQDHFLVLSEEEFTISSDFQDELDLKVTTEHSEKNYVFPYERIKGKQEITETDNKPKTQRKEPVKEKKQDIYKETHNSADEKEIEKKETEKQDLPEKEKSNEIRFSGYHDISIPKDSDISLLNQLLSKDIRSNVPVVVDYSAVNLSSAGSYEVKYILGEKIFLIHCNVT